MSAPLSDRRAVSERRAAILAHLREAGEADVAALARLHGVTPQTIRKDLNHLADRAMISRVHGGAAIGSGIANARYEARRMMAAEAKARIGRAAADLVPDGASVFINIGTTTEAVARHLVHRRDLMVVTNNLNVVDILAPNPALSVVAVGGRVRPGDRAVVGALADQFIDNFRFDWAVIGTSGLTGEGDLVDFDADEVLVTRKVIRLARRIVAVADASKVGRAAPVRIAGLAEIDHLVSDRIDSADLRRAIAAAGVDLVETG